MDRRQMRARAFAWLLLVALIVGWLPTASGSAAAFSSPQRAVNAPADPPPDALTVAPTQPAPDAHLPALALQADVPPTPLAVGDTSTITLTITNGAPDPADDLVVTLPTPDGALALPSPNTISPTAGWQWNLGHLDGASSTVLTATLLLVRMPTGQALLLQPRATARGLSLPTTATGGAIVLPADHGPAIVRFTPGAAAQLHSRDGRVQVDFPARGFARALTLRAATAPLTGTLVPSTIPGFKRGLGTFFLDATDDQGQDIHQFAQPLTITVGYTPEQLAALRIGEGTLTLFWYNDAQGRWTPLPTTVDSATQTASAVVDHFTSYTLGDGSSPSTTFIPSLQGWQVSGFTGGASYSFPIEVPSGAGGLKPNLTLNYSSATNDSDHYLMTSKQGSWVGTGWSLDTGAIALNRRDGPNTNYYSLILNGQSYDIVRGAPLTGSPYDTSHTQGWNWYATDEQFLRVRALTDDSWAVWTKDGTRYDFATTAKWGWGTSGQPTYETYKWLLTSVTDTHQNTITYSYNWYQYSYQYGLVDPDVWPSTITWGANTSTGSIDRYQVEFVSAPRRSDSSNSVSGAEDMQWDYSSSQYGGQLGAPHQTRKLNALKVWSKQASTWELVRQYTFAYDFSLYSDNPYCASGSCTSSTSNWSADPGYRKLTLLSIQRVGKDGTQFPNNTTPIKTSFSYGTNRGTDKQSNGGWNRLINVNNGQGGVLALSYENIAQYYASSGSWYTVFTNRHRVISKTLNDGRSNSYLTTYGYGAAAVNSLGSNNGGRGPNAFPNAATLFNANTTDDLDQLAIAKESEFRGHASMTERQYAGATSSTALLQTVEHDFYQGDVGCTPTAASDSDSCFVQLRDREVLKGREWRTLWTSTTGSKALREVDHTFGLQWYLTTVYDAAGYVEYPKRGLWRAFSFESQTDERTCEGTATTCDDAATPSVTPLVKMTKYFYDAGSYQSTGVQYGNLTRILEYDRGTLVRDTRHWYATRDIDTWTFAPPNPPVFTESYLVDRAWQEAIYSGAPALLAWTLSFYDTMTTANSVGAKGELWRVMKFSDAQQAVVSGTVMHSGDATYTYDSYGNRTAEKTYASAGTATYNGSAWSYSQPGNGSAARTTTTTYDTTFHAFSTQVDPPTVNGVMLTEHAGYDYRMGTLTSVTDPNGNVTSAQYDLFGRMVALIKPGDNTTYPTVQATYKDNEQPFRYRIDRREIALTANTRIEQQFYDGLGRKIQTKAESSLNAQNIVVDMRYDALNQVTAQSQPRYVSENSTTFYQYTAPPAPPTPLYNETKTTYDELGRPVLITAPDSTKAKHYYGLWPYAAPVGLISYDDVVDANRHRTQSDYDALGRLVQVSEIQGNCTNSGSLIVDYPCGGSYTTNWTGYAETQYSYSPLDLLTNATDDAGNTTSMTYDSLGRKLTMSDPDMGAWYYGYDANGQLVSQRDARGWPMTFTYDALGRMTSKFTNDASVTTFSDAFDTQNTSNWSWSANQTVPYNDSGANVVKSTGTGSSWGANFYRNAYSISSGEGVLMRFKVDATTPNAIFALETGSGASYRRYSVVAGSGKVYVQYTLDGSTYLSPPAPDVITTLQTNTWYVLQLVADDVGGFTAQVYQESNPSVRGAYTMAMPSGQSWRFHHWIYSNTAYIDSYNERSAAVYGYDAGTNGKGQRTSMGSPAASTNWSYDARGRKASASYTVPGLSSTRVFTWTYDSADRLTSVTTPAFPGGIALTASYTYDAAWRPTTLHTSNWNLDLVSNATYTALDQPDQWTFYNTLIQNWSYSSPMQRLSRLQVGSGTPASVFDRSYSYDNGGNVTAITDNKSAANNETFGYDERDRLTSATYAGTAHAYSYSTIGNLTNKAGTAYTYPAAGSARPHTPSSIGGASYSYDANGNLTGGGGRTYTWNAENLPLSVSQTSGSESYGYDADGERVKVVRGSTTTVYLEGLWEEPIGGAARQYYIFNGQAVVLYTSSPSAFTYLHADHLGSVSVATDSSHAVVSQQEYDPWGQVRSGGVPQTTLNYTGQRLDGTGLLYYHARLYDPGLGRFVSADSIVPGAASGKGGGAATLGVDSSSQLAPLTVDFHEPGFVSTLNGETAFRQQKGFFFQLSDEDKRKTGSPWGPANPQALNRYSYVLNNPVRYTDPTGHLGTTFNSNGSITFHFTHQEIQLITSWTSSDLEGFASAVSTLLAAAKIAPKLFNPVGVALALMWIGGKMLSFLDWYYGSNGLDITVDPLSGQVKGIDPPTVERQHCNIVRCIDLPYSAGAPTGPPAPPPDPTP